MRKLKLKVLVFSSNMTTEPDFYLIVLMHRMLNGGIRIRMTDTSGRAVDVMARPANNMGIELFYLYLKFH